MLEGYRTKIVGYSMAAIAILQMVVDLFDGGGFDFQKHAINIYAAMTGLGFAFLRKAQEKKA